MNATVTIELADLLRLQRDAEKFNNVKWFIDKIKTNTRELYITHDLRPAGGEEYVSMEGYDMAQLLLKIKNSAR